MLNSFELQPRQVVMEPGSYSRRRGLERPAAAAVKAAVTQCLVEVHRFPAFPDWLLRGVVVVFVLEVTVVAVVVIFFAGLIMKRSVLLETLPPPLGKAVMRRR